MCLPGEADAFSEAGLKFAGMDLVPEAVAVVSAGDHTISYINKRFAQQIAPLAKCRGLPYLSNFVHKGDHERFTLILHAAVKNAGEGDLLLLRDVDSLVLGDGSNAMPIYRRYDWAVTAAPDGLSLILSGRMVTVVDDHKKAAEAEFSDFFNKAPIALHWLSGTGHVLWANERELEVLGYTAEEYIGHSIMEFCPDEEELVLEIFKQLGSGNTIRDVPVRFRSKDGRIRNLLIDSNVNYHPDGSFNHTRCFIRDDTVRKVREARAEASLEAAREAAAAKDLFIRKIFHEIRTPCHVLTAALSELRQTIDSNGGGLNGGNGGNGGNSGGRRSGGRSTSSADESLLEQAELQAEHLRSVVNDALDAIMFDSGRVMKLMPEAFAPRALADDVLTALERELPDTTSGKVVRVIDVDDVGESVLMGDRALLFRVLHHLVVNAIQCTKEGEVRISVKRGENGKVVFGVSDTGRGIAEADAHRIFQRYWQHGAEQQTLEDQHDVSDESDAGSNGGRSATRSSVQTALSMDSGCEGLGLGLNVSYHIVECMGGQLRVKSASGATTFSFELLLPPASPADKTHSVSPPNGTAASSGGTAPCSPEDASRGGGGCLPRLLGGGGKRRMRSGAVAPAKAEQRGPGLPLERRRQLSAIRDARSWMLLSSSAIGDTFITRDRPFAFKKTPSGASDQALGAGAASGESGSGAGKGDSSNTVAVAAAPESMVGKYRCGPGLEQTRGPHILLVDDNSICRRVARKCLESLGCTCDTRGDGQAAVDAVRQNPSIYDLILMDLRMPVLDGISAARAIRKNLLVKDLPILPFSAEIGEDVREECRLAGMQGFLSKPASIYTIAQQLKQLLPCLPIGSEVTGIAIATA